MNECGWSHYDRRYVILTDDMITDILTHNDNFHLGHKTKVQGRSTPHTHYTWKLVLPPIQTFSHARMKNTDRLAYCLHVGCNNSSCFCVLRRRIHLTTQSHRTSLIRSPLVSDSLTLFSAILTYSLPHYLALHEQMKGLSGYTVT